MTTATAKPKKPTQITNPLATLGDKYVFELNAEKQSYPLTLPTGKEILVWMDRPRENLPMINLYKDGELGMRMKIISDNYVEILSSNPDSYRSHFSRFFSEITKMDGEALKSPKGKDEQLGWINDHPGLRIHEEVVTSGVLGVSISPDDTTEPTNDGDLVLDDETRSQVHTFVRVYDVEEQKTRRITLVHSIRELVETDSRKWRKASGNTGMRTQQQEYTRNENHDMMQDLYISICDGLEGAVINGKECGSDNKNDWLKLVPYNWMFLVVNRIFRGSQIKNE